MSQQKRPHSLSPQDVPPGERNPFSMPKKRAATNNTVATSRVTRSTTQAAASETGQVRPGQVVRGESPITTMAELVNKVSCGFCGADVSDESIVCTCCRKAYHPSTSCTGLKPLSIQCLREEEDSAIAYTCTTCRCIPTRVTGTTSSSSQNSDGEWKVAVGQVLEIVKSLASNMNALSASVNNVLNSSQGAGQQVSPEPPAPRSESAISRNELYTEMWEFDERKKRVSSVIVRGIQANNETDFLDKFREVVQVLLSASPQISDTYCISAEKKNFRVTFRDKATRVNIMSVARNLKDSPEYKHVFISRDLTFSQREEIRSKRDKRSSRPTTQRDAQGSGESHRNTNGTLTGANSVPVSTNLSSVPDPPPNSGPGTFLPSFQ